MGPISEAYRYIVRSAGVRSGNPIIEGTRIAVHDVVGLLQSGETIDTLTANCFPQLTRSQVYECLAYYEDHPRGDRFTRCQADGHDVPDALSYLLEQLGHDVTLLRKALPGNSRDEAVLEFAHEHGCVLPTCNRDDFLHLATTRPHHGIVIVIRRRSRAYGRAALSFGCWKVRARLGSETTSTSSNRR